MRHFGIFLAVGLLTTGAAYAQVDANLGNVISGSPVSISGTTVGRSNDIDTYSTGNAAAVWDQDFIYQFNLAAPGTLTLDTNDPDTSPDMDFFLLSSLATTVNPNGLRQATSIASTSADGLVFVDGSWTVTAAGTYYLAIDAWRGNPTLAETPATGRAGAFSGSLSFTAAVPVTPPASTGALLSPSGSSVGNLAPGQVSWLSFTYSGIGGVSFNTDGSGFDTELGLYNSFGQLITNDDDNGAGTASLINAPAGLVAGTYYLALGGFNTTFGASGFSVTPGTAGGNYIINGVVTVPEPTTPLLLGLGALVGAVVHVRKRHMKR